jgi:ribose transport system substrate-binding protein
MSGKTFAMITLNAKSNLAQAEMAGMKKALALVGANLITFDGKGTPEVIAQAVQSAISQHVAGIVAGGLDPDSVKSSIADAKAAKIPVIAATSHEPDAPLSPDGVVANVAVNGIQEGKIQADYALAKSNCKLHGAVFFCGACLTTVDTATGVAAEIKKLCPTDCSLEKVDFNVATYATTLAGQVQTTLQRSPDINYLISTGDLFVPYILQAQKAIGSNAPIVSALGDGLDAAIHGNGQVADLQWPSGEVVGFYFADAVMRAATGHPVNEEIPFRLLDSSNWGTSGDDSVQYPDQAKWEDAFKTAWRG